MRMKRNKILTILGLGAILVSLGVVPALAGYNGNSGSSGVNVGGNGNGNNNYRPVNDLGIDSQGFSFSLYFLPMPVELLGNTPDKVAARNEYWTTNFESAIDVGRRELLVSRDGFKKYGNGINKAFTGNIASTLGGGETYKKIKLAENQKNPKIESVNCSDIGLDSDTFPVYVDSLNGKGIDKGDTTFEYFMDLNEDYVPGESPYAFVSDNMKNLTRYLAGVGGDGIANVSFKSDKDIEEVAGITYKKNEQSVYDEGTYGGAVGEYRVFIEGYVVANGTAYTLPELATEADKEGLNNSYLFSLKPSFVEAMGEISLTEDDAFGLKAVEGNIIKSMSTKEVRDTFKLKPNKQ